MVTPSTPRRSVPSTSGSHTRVRPAALTRPGEVLGLDLQQLEGSTGDGRVHPERRRLLLVVGTRRQERHEHALLEVRQVRQRVVAAQDLGVLGEQVREVVAAGEVRPSQQGIDGLLGPVQCRRAGRPGLADVASRAR